MVDEGGFVRRFMGIVSFPGSDARLGLGIGFGQGAGWRGSSIQSSASLRFRSDGLSE